MRSLFPFQNNKQNKKRNEKKRKEKKKTLHFSVGVGSWFFLGWLFFSLSFPLLFGGHLDTIGSSFRQIKIINSSLFFIFIFWGKVYFYQNLAPRVRSQRALLGFTKAAVPADSHGTQVTLEFFKINK